jgi:hypothetical protein
MPWKPSEDHDREIRRWMESKGWEVTRTNHDADRKVYAWRHQLVGRWQMTNAPDLPVCPRAVSRLVLLYHLNQLKVV